MKAPSAQYENETLTIPFHNILAYLKQVMDKKFIKLEDLGLTEEEASSITFYELTIKYQNSSENTKMLLTESEVNKFQKQFNEWLDYRTANVPSSTEHVNLFIEKSKEILQETQEQASQLFEKINNSYSSKLNELTQENVAILEKTKVEASEAINSVLQHTSNLEKLNNMIGEFVTTDEELETPDQEVLEAVKNESTLEKEELLKV